MRFRHKDGGTGHTTAPIRAGIGVIWDDAYNTRGEFTVREFRSECVQIPDEDECTGTFHPGDTHHIWHGDQEHNPCPVHPSAPLTMLLIEWAEDEGVDTDA